MTRRKVPYCKCGHPRDFHEKREDGTWGRCLHGLGTATGGCAECVEYSGNRKKRKESSMAKRATPDRDRFARFRRAMHEVTEAIIELHLGNDKNVGSALVGVAEFIAPIVGLRSPNPPKAPKATTSTPPPDGLSRGEHKLLVAIAQGASDHAQLAVLTGYKSRSITTYLQLLRQQGHVERGEIRVTNAGITALGSSYQPLPTGDALCAYWYERLSGGESVLFKALVEAYPRSLSHEELRVATSYAERSVTTYVQLLKARKIVVKDGRSLRASDNLFTRPRRAAGA